ncbi:MAG: hemolysin [Niastella sp. SCN 39-18]|nr:HlyC/CorC family transporter [Sphingobacteriales bacterium]ODT52323.1 MAG: hemolysin [Niastella sp. SCN 39-18]OJW10403.1 MAG: hemolysin [Sphingobacteriales bacterium 39-19]
MTEILIVLFLIFLNGLFVIAEISLVSARRSRLEAWANKGDRKAKSALDLAENPERFLSTVQIGITLISILTGVYTGEKFGGHLKPFIENIEIVRPYAGQIATAIVVIIVTFFSIIFGELIPKKFGLLRAEKIARAAATPMNFLSRLMMPFVWLLSKCTNFIFKIFNIKASTDNAVTEEEIKAMVAEGSEYGSIDEEEKEIIERVFHLGDRNITSLMTHRTDIVWLDINDSVQEIKQKLNTIVFNTYPVCEESIDNIKGLVYVKDLLKATPETKLNQLIKEALFVPENNKAYQLLEKMKGAKIHTAFIVNEYGTLEGMITLNDILEAIVGDVPQTDQEEYEIIKREDGSYLVDAQIHFYDFLSYFERADWMNEGEHDFDTVAGFVLHELEHIPHEGEQIEWKDFKFEILDMDGQRIDKILVTISQQLKEELEEA